jgi:hypothetical protein
MEDRLADTYEQGQESKITIICELAQIYIRQL